MQFHWLVDKSETVMNLSHEARNIKHDRYFPRGVARSNSHARKRCRHRAEEPNWGPREAVSGPAAVSSRVRQPLKSGKSTLVDGRKKMLGTFFFVLFLSPTVRINPCDSGPCHNGGACVPDDDVVLEYSCDCRPGYSGETCDGNYPTELFETQTGFSWDAMNRSSVCGAGAVKQKWFDTDREAWLWISLDLLPFSIPLVPPSYEVTCLRYDQKIYSIKLGDVSEILDWEHTKPAIDFCRKLAHAKGLRNFAIGSTYQCVGMPNKDTRQQRTSSGGCLEGVGKKLAVFAYTFGKSQKRS